MFINLGNKIVPILEIRSVEISSIETETVVVTTVDNITTTVSGFAAVEIVWLLKPSALEGNANIKWKKHAWVIHNLFAHPIMQILAFLKLYKQAIWIHDITVPKPIGYKHY